MITNLLTLTFILLLAAVAYALRERILGALRRFNANNAARRAEEMRARFDKYAHYRQTVSFAEEQIEAVAKIAIPDPRTGLPVERFVFLGIQYATRAEAEAARPILILGGTQFIGVHMTQLALRRGHEVTLFNRGKTNIELFPQVEKLRGDRNGQLDALRGRSWDAVIDDSGYVPRHVRLSAQLLAPHVQRYVFISTISAYASFATPPNEDSPLATLSDASTDKVTNDTYGGLKALCEREVATAMPHRGIVLRPGIIVGPYDPTDRFTYWPARAARGGAMLAPGSPGEATQYIDARDLARFVIDTIEHGRYGTFNLVTPPGRFTMGELVGQSIQTAKALAKPSAMPKAVWVMADFLERQNVTPGPQLPMWFPTSGDGAGFGQVSSTRAIEAGLQVTPIAVTVRDTLAWHLRRPESDRAQLKSGLTSEHEAQLLSAWSDEVAQSGKPTHGS